MSLRSQSTHAVALSIAALLLAGVLQSRAAAVEARVGVVAYQDLERGMADFERLFRELAESLDRPVQFRLTMGTYGDIIYWLDKRMVDVALLTPGAFAAAIREERSGSRRCEYLASRLVPHAAEDRAQPATAMRTTPFAWRPMGHHCGRSTMYAGHGRPAACGLFLSIRSRRRAISRRSSR